jgi:uncharacterized protein YdeI (YjbR/CyaY-like superfamily)
MARKDPRIDKYIAGSAEFAQPILTHLRKLVHTGCPEVEETLKWGMPSFLYKGILCGVAAFKEHCKFGFWKHDLLFGNDPIAQKRAAEAMGSFGRITKRADLPSDAELLRLIKEAARLNDAGVKRVTKPRPKGNKELIVPDYLVTALKKNKKAQATFDGFSYSHKKEYVEWLTEAKREETRDRRLATTIEWLTKGKARHWQYANC